MLALLAELGRPAPGADPAPQLAVVARWCETPGHVVLVAEENETLVGLAALEIRERLGWVMPEAWLSDLVVQPAARRRGIARRLVEACLECAVSSGCRWIRLECGLERGDAQAFYAKLGFERFGVDLRLRLSGTGEVRESAPPPCAGI